MDDKARLTSELQSLQRQRDKAVSPGERPEFSVLIPVHDRTTELANAIDSVLEQTNGDFEVIIVTNDSPAATLAVILGYMKRDARIRGYLYDDNTGNACRGRNRGIVEARGTYISLLDSDDLYFPDTLAIASRCFNKEQVDVVAGCARWRVDGTRLVEGAADGSRNHPVPISMAVFMRDNPFMTCTVHIRRDVLLRYGGFRPEQKYLEDLECWLRLAHRGCRFHYTDEIVAQYTLHAKNTELNFIDKKEEWFVQMWRSYDKEFLNWGI